MGSAVSWRASTPEKMRMGECWATSSPATEETGPSRSAERSRHRHGDTRSGQVIRGRNGPWQRAWTTATDLDICARPSSGRSTSTTLCCRLSSHKSPDHAAVAERSFAFRSARSVIPSSCHITFAHRSIMTENRDECASYSLEPKLALTRLELLCSFGCRRLSAAVDGCRPARFGY